MAAKQKMCNSHPYSYSGILNLENGNKKKQKNAILISSIFIFYHYKIEKWPKKIKKVKFSLIFIFCYLKLEKWQTKTKKCNSHPYSHSGIQNFQNGKRTKKR